MKRFAFVFCLLSIPVMLVGQEKPEAAPGLRVPGTAMPYALDSFAGKPELIPIQHSNVSGNNHAGANAAGQLAGSFFYKPKGATGLRGRRRRSLCTLADLSFISIMTVGTTQALTAMRILLAGQSYAQNQIGTDALLRRFASLSSLATASTTMTLSTPRKAIFRTAGRRLHQTRT